MSIDRDRLVAELAEFREIAFPTPPKGHHFERALLISAKNAVVIGRVLMDCALIEELSALVLMHYWLAKDRVFMGRLYFGRIKRYKSLSDALGRLPARQKMATLRKVTRVPKSVASNIDRMLAIRDVFAHVRTIENQHPSILYKGASIFSTPGLRLYLRDSKANVEWFIRKARIRNQGTK